MSKLVNEYLDGALLWRYYIFLQVEIGWDDILQEDSTKGIFKMELEDIEEDADYEFEDGSEVGFLWSRFGNIASFSEVYIVSPYRFLTIRTQMYQ